MKPLALVTPPARHHRLSELGGLLLLLCSVLLLLALVSYRATDPSLDTASHTGLRSTPGSVPDRAPAAVTDIQSPGSADPAAVGSDQRQPGDAGAGLSEQTAAPHALHNWTGRVGAVLSDLLLQVEGAAAFGLPLLLAALGLGRLRSPAGTRAAFSPDGPARMRRTGLPWARLAGLTLALLIGPACFAMLPWHLLLFGAIPIGGVAGLLVLDALAAWLNYPGACVLILFLAAVSLSLLTSLSLTSARQSLLIRSAWLARLRDRLHNWRARREERKTERAERKALAREAKALRAAAVSDDNPDESDTLAGSLDETAIRNDFAPGAALPATSSYAGPALALFEDDGIPLARRGSFAETSEARPRMATRWDDEDFSDALTPLDPDHREGHSARTLSITAAAPQVPPAAQATLPTQAEAIAFTPRADANQRPVTMTAKTVTGYESAWKLPPTTLLHRSEESHEVRQEALRLEAQVLIEKCAEFDVGGQVTQINPGPVVTTFEFRPEAGVKYSRVTGLAEDLCLAMAAESILIERMAGKSTVGIQVPNAERETIWLRDIIEAEGFAGSKSRITMAMGKDINGRTVVADLATMPHVLIAGSTGSGKSVAINAMIMSVLYKATPEQVRLILVDPKRVELGMYEGVPHLFTPIITEPKLAANALKNAVREMERRLKLLAARSVRNIDQYNRLFTDTLGLFDEQGAEEKPLPYIMIIIDELADLMILDKSNVEEAITRLAQMARAVGIHLVLATQRPSVDVITGLIKANVPTRMSFRLATKIDSRTILDANGAESLLGRGDMLFLPPGTSRLQRVHAPFVTENEISGVVAFWKAQGEAQYVEAFLDAPKDANGNLLDGDGGPGGSGGDDNDPMFDDAVRLVFEFGKASTSLLQRRMRIGYGRAAHLIDLMERDGLVGPPEGSKPRELLKPANWLNDADEALR